MKQALIASLNHILNASFLKPSGHIETLLHMPANKKKRTSAHLYSASVP